MEFDLEGLAQNRVQLKAGLLNSPVQRKEHVFKLGYCPLRLFGAVRALFSFFHFLLYLDAFHLKVCDGEYYVF